MAIRYFYAAALVAGTIFWPVLEQGLADDAGQAKSLAEAALGKEGTPPLPINAINYMDFLRVRTLPRDIRSHGSPAPKEVVDHAKYVLAITSCLSPRLAPAGAAQELSAILESTSFAPVSKGLAVIILRGTVQSTTGDPTFTTVSKIVPVVVQLDGDSIPIASYWGRIRDDRDGSWHTAIKLHQSATSLLVTFVRADHTPVSTKWKGKKLVRNGRFGGIAIDRKEMVAAYAKDVRERKASKDASKIREASEVELRRIAAMDLRDWRGRDSARWRAEFVEYEKGVVTLRDVDLEVFTVRLRDLSKEDQRYVQRAVKELKAKRSEEKESKRPRLFGR